MSALVLMICTYAAVVIFIGVVAYRTIKIARMPVHLRWELAPVPHEKGKSAYGGSYLEEYEWWTKERESSIINEMVYMAKEIFLLKGVWANNRGLWPFTFLFHNGIYLLAAAVGFVFISAVLLTFASAVAVLDFTLALVSIFVIGGYLTGTVGSSGLLVKRFVDPDLKPFNSTSTYLNLVLMGLLFGSGLFAFFATGDYALELSYFARSVITLSPQSYVAIPVGLHIIIALIFLTYLPFTSMIHFVAKYFTYHEVRWNDRPQSVTMTRKLNAQLQQPMSWSAPHVKSDGKKNWVDAATEEMKDEKKPEN
ncbi:MAG TPA: respiratory nitrate reductase subunit gamma [Spirochaetota bacterium]|nr:respiratory nitrate reductase subunit gamma [Spirochaetota bacterium]